MATEYQDAPEVESIARSLYGEFPDWHDVPEIKYLFKVSEKSSFAAQIHKPAGIWSFLTDKNYVMEVWAECWEDFSMKQREALIFHELKHIKCKERDDGELTWVLVDHDCEEFVDVIRRYGAWNKVLQDIKPLLNDKEEKKETLNVTIV